MHHHLPPRASSSPDIRPPVSGLQAYIKRVCHWEKSCGLVLTFPLGRERKKKGNCSRAQEGGRHEKAELASSSYSLKEGTTCSMTQGRRERQRGRRRRGRRAREGFF